MKHSFSPQEKAAAALIAEWWKRMCIESIYYEARKEFESIANEIGDLPPKWGENIHSLPRYHMNDECEMAFAVSAISSRKAELKYDEFVAQNLKPVYRKGTKR